METIKLKSRYGDIHSLIPIDEKHYIFKSSEDWMPVRLIGEAPFYSAVDPDGGPFINIGDIIEGKHVKTITSLDSIIIEFS